MTGDEKMREKLLKAIAKRLYPYIMEQIKNDYSYVKMVKQLQNDKLFQDSVEKILLK